MSEDKGNKHILAILPGIAGLIEDAMARILEDLDTEQAEHDQTRERLRAVRLRAEGYAKTLADIAGWLNSAERGRLSEQDAVALIRGRLLGGRSGG